MTETVRLSVNEEEGNASLEVKPGESTGSFMQTTSENGEASRGTVANFVSGRSVQLRD